MPALQIVMAGIFLLRYNHQSFFTPILLEDFAVTALSRESYEMHLNVCAVINKSFLCLNALSLLKHINENSRHLSY